jgi:hypothetical protein
MERIENPSLGPFGIQQRYIGHPQNTSHAARREKMKKTLMYFVLSAAAFATPAWAQRAETDPRYPVEPSQGVPDIERQIQRLDDKIHAEDAAGRISPSEADTLVRELRDIETQLLDVRSRTFRGSENVNPSERAPDTWNGRPSSAPYPERGDPNDDRPDDSRDSRGGVAY